MKYNIKVSPRDKPRSWTVLEGIVIEGVLIPAGFHFDGASIPMGLRWAFPHGGPKFAPACAHDYLYRNTIGTREAADKVFFKAMVTNGVNINKAKVVYLGVRVGGWVAWQRNKK